MNGFLKGRLWSLPLAGVCLVLGAVAQAEPITATVENNGGGYTLIHIGSNPGGTAGTQDDWWRFDDGQTLNLDLDRAGGLLTLDGGPQSLSLFTNNGAIGNIDFTGLAMDLNDSDGFLGGTMDYVLNSSTAGTFSFSNSNFGSSPFNSSNYSAAFLNLFAWGGDDGNNLGIDFGMSAPVPEPSTALLLLVGVAGFAAVKRKRK